MVYDVRSICNFVILRARERRVEVTNLSLNKLVFFLHSEVLIKTGTPLTDAKIEAWTYGPVYREIYNQFKNHSDKPITSLAEVMNRKTGQFIVADVDFPEQIVKMLDECLELYLGMSAFQLVDLSHNKDGPWHDVFHHEGKSNPGMQITDELILECAFGKDSSSNGQENKKTTEAASSSKLRSLH